MGSSDHQSSINRVKTLGGNFYDARLSEHGPSAQGVGWNSAEAQRIRFAELVKVIADSGTSRRISVNDYGSGLGALHSYLRENGYNVDYTGYDISSAMVDEARSIHHGDEAARFTTDENELRPADYSFACGLFNKRFTPTDDEWREYVISVIERLAVLSTKGFAFNMLTSYSDADRMREDHFYADPSFFFDLCMRRFGRRAALLHHYEAFDFTILVLHEDRKPPPSEVG